MSLQPDCSDLEDKVREAIAQLAEYDYSPHDRQHARDLLDGLTSMAPSTIICTQVEQFKEEIKTLGASTTAVMSKAAQSTKSDLDRVVTEARQAVVKASAAIQKEEQRASAALSLAKQDCDQHVALAKRSIVDATRAILDERLKAVDTIALHTANATRQSPTLPDIVQAVSSLHASTTIHPSPHPSSSNEKSIIDDLTRRLSALETSANQKQANIDKLVESKVTDALAKQNQRHQQMLDSLVQSKIDKVLAKQDQKPAKPAQVLDSMIQNKIDKTLAKLDKRFEKELAGVRGELAAALAGEKNLSEVRAKEQEKYQQVLEAISDEMVSIPCLLSLVEEKVDEYLASKEDKEERKTSVIVDDEVRTLIDKAVDDKLATRVEATIIKHNEEHEHDLKAVRHDILDLAHSFLQVKSAIQASSRAHDGSTTQSVSKMEDKLALLTKVTDLKRSTLGSSVATTISKLAPATPAIATTAPSSPSALSPQDEDEGDDYAVTDGSDDEDSTIPEVSDDGYCIMEPSRSERAELIVDTLKASKSGSHKTGPSEPSSPTSTSTTFDNTGPLTLDVSHTRALLMAALAVGIYHGTLLVHCATVELEKPPSGFLDLYDLYHQNVVNPMCIDPLWISFKALINSQESTTTNITTAKTSGSGPVLWEGAGLEVDETSKAEEKHQREVGKQRQQKLRQRK